MDVFKDERFKHVAKDPKFRNVPRKDRKVKIDKRFEGMFTDDKFKLKYSVDQRGRPMKHSQIEDLKKYYSLSEDSDEHSSTEEETVNTTKSKKGEKKKQKSIKKLPVKSESESEEEVDEVEVSNQQNTKEAELITQNSELLDTNDEERSILTEKVLERLQDPSIDYARGEGILDTDTSSSDEATTEDSEEVIEHDWGELDKDAEQTEEATKRLAVCHLDWDRVRATDIMVLLHSFLPPTGYIQSVTIYPSDFGLQRMKEEEIKGPQELTAKKVETEDNKESSDEDDEYHREKLRQYQMKRLRYFYAVVIFDSVESANKVYTECDRMEYESSATKLDLRFIPDDMTFDQEPRESCSSLPAAGNYKPLLFANTALQQEKVELTWDETDPSRLDLSRRLAQGAAVSEADLKAFIATSSEESDDQPSSHDEAEEDEEEEKKDKDVKENKDDISKYRSLLAGIQREEERRKKGKVEMEISWDLAVENRTKAVEQKNKDQSLTPFQKMMKNKQDKKKSVNKKVSDDDNLLSDDDLPSDIDMNDPFFQDELGGSTKKGQKKTKKKDKNVKDKSDDEEDMKRKAELELLLAEDEDEAGKKHFSLKAIQEREANQNKKGKKSKKQNNQEEDDFKIDLKDNRFGALFTSHLFNVDPADSHFRKTKAMDDIIAEKSKRRRQNSDRNESTSSKKLKSDGPQLSSEVTQLLSSVKKKATKLNNT